MPKVIKLKKVTKGEVDYIERTITETKDKIDNLLMSDLEQEKQRKVKALKSTQATINLLNSQISELDQQIAEAQTLGF